MDEDDNDNIDRHVHAPMCQQNLEGPTSYPGSAKASDLQVVVFGHVKIKTMAPDDPCHNPEIGTTNPTLG